MRKDISDVFHDRPKAGRRWDQGDKGEKRAIQKIDIEDLPHRGPNHKGGRHKNYHSTPIRRFLQSQIGQKWDDVYKQLSEACDIRSNPQREVLEQVDWLVERNTQMIDGIPHDAKGNKIQGSTRGVFYVHPIEKTLEIHRSPKTTRRWKPKPYVKIDNLHQCHFINGVWYSVEFKPYKGEERIEDILLNTANQKDNRYTPYYWNHFGTDSTYTRQSLIDRYGSAIYPVSKLQCNKKEIKKINVELEKMRKADQK